MKGVDEKMKDWKEKLFCAAECSRCHRPLKQKDERILSSYDHEAICMTCKKSEEKRPDYEEVSKRMIGQCLSEAELKQSDPESFCYNHFYAYRC